jgi:DNA-binding GntR family transcriptional regulator
MPYEYTPPKYAQVIAELQRRIESGEYPPGSLMPSEHQLSAEFAIARPTVVRALRVLRQEGWIETQQGKGSFVRSRSPLADLAPQRRGQAELDRIEAKEIGEVVNAGLVTPPPRIAAMLDMSEGVQVISRRRLVYRDGEPSEIVTWWFPQELAEDTSLGGTAPLPDGIRDHLARRKGVRTDYLAEIITARHPAPHEVKLLKITRSAPILAVYVTARHASGNAQYALDIAMAGDRHELEDVYQVS